MKKSFVQKSLIGLLAVALVGIAFQTRAEDKATEAKPETATEAAKPKKDRLPFSGTVSAVDKAAMTISVKKKESEKTYEITSTTKFVKGGKPATLEDVVVGEECGGSYKKTEAGKLEALSVRLGPKPEATPKKAKSKKAETTAPTENK